MVTVLADKYNISLCRKPKTKESVVNKAQVSMIDWNIHLI